MVPDKYGNVKSDTGFIDADAVDSFSFRLLSNGSIGVAVQSGLAAGLDETLYSNNAFSFRLEDPKRLKSIPRSQWDSGRPIKLFRTDAFDLPVSNYTSGGQSLTYRGISYASSGQHLMSSECVALLSPNHRWLVLQSYEEHAYFGSLRWPEVGTLYTDLFDTSNGRKLMSIQLHLWDVHAARIGPKTAWLTDSHFFIDPSDRRDSFILCHVK